MNCVGAGGKGESIWLGWFLYATLQEFAPYAAARGEPERAARWTAVAAAIAAALERYGWDGSWYLRAYFDDGTPLGSARDLECRIDSIAQSWAVLSGAAAPDRALQAMAAVQTQLIDADAGLALLFTPPFDHTPLDPGYIKGYPPGIRENGGQYTHAALWSVMALARLGHGTQAGLLFALLNPVNQAGTRAAAQRYKVEPYVVAADVYSVAPHVGRGGWTWYTGSAGWMYRAGLESILGLRIHGATLELSPCLPEHWPSATISYKRGSTRYDIAIENPGRVSRGIIETRIDGIIAPIPGGPMSTPIAVSIPWVDDGAIHRIRLLLGAPNHGIAS
jgi:cyclic beta-1,2-glucan synthetase